MQKIALTLFSGCAIALVALWAFDKPQHAAALLPRAEKEPYPVNYFASPIGTTIHPTGTCGELRPNHFHAGLDIDGKIGDAVYAAADGQIETIRVQPNGYGNILFVRHPNGYVTAYAHLSRFSADIQAYVRQYQYEHECFEVDLKLPDGTFPVRQGQQIAYLGNTGGSTGPHLHFEIRSPSGKAINPLLCGIPVADNVAPEIRDMKVYFLNERREVLGSKPFPIEKDKSGVIGLEGDTIRIGGSRIGFGVKAYDRTSVSKNENGVFSVALYTDDQLSFQWTADEFDFDDARYLNAHIDYPARQRYGSWFHRCYTLPGDFLNNYTSTPSMGAIDLNGGQPVKITLKVGDAAGNMSTLNFWAVRDDSIQETFLSAPYQFALPFDAETRIDLDGFMMQMPKGGVYETVQFQYLTTEDSTSRDIFSPMHHLHDDRTPVHKPFVLKIKPTRLPEYLHDKAVIANCNSGRPDNCGGTWEGDWLITNVRAFGDYCIMADTIPPRISPVIFSKDMRRKTSIAFRILDNFAVAGNAKDVSYRGTIDGRWVLFELDKKRNRITYEFDGHVGKGNHTVEIVAKDDRGNEGFFRGRFLR